MSQVYGLGDERLVPFNETGTWKRTGLERRGDEFSLIYLDFEALGIQEHILSWRVWSLESLGWSYKYVSVPEMVIKIVG